MDRTVPRVLCDRLFTYLLSHSLAVEYTAETQSSLAFVQNRYGRESVENVGTSIVYETS